MSVFRVVLLYFKFAKVARKRENDLDSTSQLIHITKYLWLGFSWLIAAGFAFFTSFPAESREFFDIVEMSSKEFVHRLILYSSLSLYAYHFLPIMRKQVIVINKHQPYSIQERFGINFLVNTFRLSVINILGVWIIFFLVNPSFFSFESLIHAILQLIITLVLIFNLKELLTWSVPKIALFLIANLFFIVMLAFIALRQISILIYVEIIVLIGCLILSLITEKVKIERSKIGSLATNHNPTIAALQLPIRTKNSFKLLKFILTFELLPLLVYNFLTLEIFETVIYFTMMLPLSLMTNYGNNVFGYAFKTSMNIFFRPVNQKNIITLYSQLVFVPYLISLTISTAFFYFYSENFFQDIAGYLCISVILLILGYLLSLKYPIKIMDSIGWTSRGNQSRISTMISVGTSLLWLIQISLSFKFAIIIGLVTIIVLLNFIFFSKTNSTLINTFKHKIIIAMKS